ncbi:enoyl-CoA hydratase/isomerase family protein [Gordonia hydrophobica]|uniref:Enoyl-CoA hydratase/isomerase family protein n=1 Tax=Gordonia hydrophobica TaxID=40516 RepID=A0ABZ2U6H6_9ACTN|nr:enoyl-CoA hydratase/isomerase family protein [Gordonia hydrophobica]MBM7365405.1 enoyl-CoA hydratase/carnithine racemase [Gordonia hydrophobica]
MSEGDSPVDDRVTVDVQSVDDGRVAVVTFGHGRNNYLTFDLVDELASTFERVAAQGSRAIVLRSQGRHFCAGAKFTGSREKNTTAPHVFDVVPRLFQQPLPMIAVVQGAAIGAGLGLALAADFRVAAPETYFLANFNRLGISPGFGLSVTLPRLVGGQFSADMFYSARRVGGEEAVTRGLADRLVEPDAQLATAIEWATQIATSSPVAVQTTRRSLRADVNDAIASILHGERELQDPMLASPDFAEGVAAWRDKRRPQFSGD